MQVLNSKVSLGNLSITTAVTYTCPDGQVTTVTCQNGTWANPVLECGNSLSVPLESNLVLEHQTKQQEKEKAARQPTTSLYTSILQPTTTMPTRNRVEQNPPENVIKTENTQNIPGGVSVPGGSEQVVGHYFSNFVSLLVIFVRTK